MDIDSIESIETIAYSDESEQVIVALRKKRGAFALFNTQNRKLHWPPVLAAHAIIDLSSHTAHAAGT